MWICTTHTQRKTLAHLIVSLTKALPEIQWYNIHQPKFTISGLCSDEVREGGNSVPLCSSDFTSSESSPEPSNSNIKDRVECHAHFLLDQDTFLSSWMSNRLSNTKNKQKKAGTSCYHLHEKLLLTISWRWSVEWTSCPNYSKYNSISDWVNRCLENKTVLSRM